MIALYRMLHIIQKDEAAAIGLAAEMGKSPTLGALMELAKKFQHIRSGEAVDMQVDESFGQLQRLIRPEGNIKGAVEQTSDPSKPMSHMDVVLDRFVDVASPAVLEALLLNPDGLEKPLEDLAAPGILPETSAYSASDTVNAAKVVFERMVAEQIQAFVAANPQLVHFLAARNIATTVGNIKSLEKLTRSNRALADELEAAEQERDEELDTDSILDSLQDTSLSGLRKGSTVGLLLARILDAVNSSLPGKSSASIESLLAVTHALNGDSENGFQLPIKVNGRISNLQLYVLNERALTQDGARILLSLDTKNLGLVTAYFTMNAEGVDVVITGQSEKAVTALTKRTEALTQMLFGAGVKIENLQVLLDKEPALETSLPPDALQQWATDSPEVRNITSSSVDMRV
jgi:hypothetical protein